MAYSSRTFSVRPPLILNSPIRTCLGLDPINLGGPPESRLDCAGTPSRAYSCRNCGEAPKSCGGTNYLIMADGSRRWL